MMSVGDGDGERVGGVWSHDRGAGQQALDHGVDLRLVGGSGAYHRLLDQRRRIFADLDPGAGREHQGNAAGLAELEGRLRVLVDEHFLDRGAIRRPVGEQRLDLRSEVGQAFRQRLLGVGPELAVGDMAEAVAVGADQAPAGGAEPRIEAEDQRQPNFSSSSSGTS